MLLNKKIYQTVLFVFLVFFSNSLLAGEEGGNKSTGGILITARSGMSLFMTEVYRDFSGMESEFSNGPGLFAGLEASRFFTPSLEAGAGIATLRLKGTAEAPAFSAIGHQYYLDHTIEGPVQFSNRLFGPQLFARYHFRLNRGSDRPLSVFVKAGAGVLFNESELYFSNRKGDEIIFGKGVGKYKSTQLVNGVYSLGSGLSIALSDRIGLNLAANLNMVGYDFLDVVHNYDASGNRRDVVGLFTDVTAGISVQLGKKKATNNRSKQKGGSEHLPFSTDYAD